MTILHSIHLCLLIALFGFNSSAKSYKYNELQIKDYDQMLAEVESRLTKARQSISALDPQDTGNELAEQEAIEILRDGLLLVFSRPNKDNMVSKLVPLLKKELNNLNAYEDSIAMLVTRALAILKNDKLPIYQRSTSIFVLENIMSELRPELRDKPAVKRVFEKIRDANIDIANELRNDRKLKSMFKTRSPSDIARHLLNRSFPKGK